MTEKITFTIQRDIRLGKVIVGHIDYRALIKGSRWKVKLNAASGKPGIVGNFTRLKDAKAAAITALSQ